MRPFSLVCLVLGFILLAAGALLLHLGRALADGNSPGDQALGYSLLSAALLLIVFGVIARAGTPPPRTK